MKVNGHIKKSTKKVLYIWLIKFFQVARKVISNYIFKPKKKRPGVHSKNASRGQTGYKKKYRGQGKRN